MKYTMTMAVLLLATIMTTSCKGGDSTKNTTDSCTAKEDSVIVEEAPKEVNIEERKISKTYYFIATQAEIPHYGDYTVTVNWPEKCEGFDLTKLQIALCGGDGDIEKKIKEDYTALFPTALWKKVNKKPNISDDENSEMMEEPYEQPWAPNGGVQIERLKYDKNPDLAIYEMTGFHYMGCGLGACALPFDTVVIFDVRADNVVHYDDLFVEKANDYIMKRLQKDHGDFEEDADEMWKVKRISHNIVISEKTCSFIYDKYEIDCGAAGMVRLDIPLKDLLPYMTDYGKEVLRLQ